MDKEFIKVLGKLTKSKARKCSKPVRKSPSKEELNQSFKFNKGTDKINIVKKNYQMLNSSFGCSIGE